MIRKTLIIFFVMCGVCYGAEINEKYSYKDFMNISFKHLDASEFNDSIIVGSCFHQDEVDVDVFPDGLINVTFRTSNLDNVLLKSGMIFGEGNSTRKLKIQNDGMMWLVEKDPITKKYNPIEPQNKEIFEKANYSILPKDIPNTEQINFIKDKIYENENSISIN